MCTLCARVEAVRFVQMLSWNGVKMDMRGFAAGAAGTIALDVYTYADMAVRARPASDVPARVVQLLAQKAHFPSFASEDGDEPKNRRSGASALMGYGVGLGAAVAYAEIRPAFRAWLPWPIAGLLLGAATLIVSEGSATRLGATDWSKWSASDWVSDIVPRSLYGLVTAFFCEHLCKAGSSGGGNGA